MGGSASSGATPWLSSSVALLEGTTVSPQNTFRTNAPALPVMLTSPRGAGRDRAAEASLLLRRVVLSSHGEMFLQVKSFNEWLRDQRR
jgi:hypothetical protein